MLDISFSHLSCANNDDDIHDRCRCTYMYTVEIFIQFVDQHKAQQLLVSCHPGPPPSATIIGQPNP